MGRHQTKKLRTTQDNINEMKRKPMEWERIFTNCVLDKERIQLNSKKPNNPVKKWAKNMNRCFSKENTQKVNGYIKSCSMSLEVMKTQIKTTMGCHPTPARMALIKNKSDKCW